jgi:hypothetical protein
MYNIITNKDEDPKEEFQNLWLNTRTGTLFIWNKQPVIVGLSKQARVFTEDEFECEFVYTEKRNHRKKYFKFDYKKIPVNVVVETTQEYYEGSDIKISFGSLYGIAPLGKTVLRSDKFTPGDLVVECDPTRGSVKVKISVLGYE